MRKGAGLSMVFLLVAPLAWSDMRVSAPPLSDTELADLRGGFVLDNLEIAIGLEQVVAVNGDTLVVNRLQIPDLNRPVSNAWSSQMETVLSANVPGLQGLELVSGAAGNGGWMTVIQNSLNSTVIQNTRQLNIELNNLGGAYRLPRDSGLPLILP